MDTLGGILISVGAPVIATLILSALGGCIAWIHKLDERVFSMTERVVTREDLRPGERRWDDCETRGPNQCEPGCVRPSLHDGDCRGSVEGSGAERANLNAQTAFPATIREAIEQEWERNANSAFCAATMPGNWCTRREHADDRHVWAMSDEEAQRILRAGQELGFVAEAGDTDGATD